MNNINAIADPHQVIGTTPKQQPGQAGHDGQPHLRTRRVETRVSPDEHVTICAFATAQGYSSIAQYVRQQALYGSNDSRSSQHKAMIACQAELNDITIHVNQIARHLTEGESLDEEMLMVMMQVLDLAAENLKRITTEGTQPKAEAA